MAHKGKIRTLASRSAKRVTILGVKVVTAAKIESESALSKADEEVAELVALVMDDSRLSTVMARASDL